MTQDMTQDMTQNMTQDCCCRKWRNLSHEVLKVLLEYAIFDATVRRRHHHGDVFRSSNRDPNQPNDR